jgi:hypothetical protein
MLLAQIACEHVDITGGPGAKAEIAADHHVAGPGPGQHRSRSRRLPG